MALSFNPQFVEAHRLSPFNSRGTDVPVVLDLMIHDIGILLSVIKSKIKSINAKGIKIVYGSKLFGFKSDQLSELNLENIENLIKNKHFVNKFFSPIYNEER